MLSSVRLLAVAAAIVVVTAAAPARAQDEDRCAPRDGLSTCIASDNLWTYPGGGRWFSQAPTDTAADESASFGLTHTFTYRPIGLRVASPDPEGTIIYAVEAAFGATFLMGIGVGDRLELGLAAPVVLYQTGASKSDVVGSDEALPRSAVGDLRFGARLALVHREPGEDGPALAARFEMAAPTGQDNAFVGYSTATWAPALSFDQRFGSLYLGADFGGRFRDTVELAATSIGSQLSASLGVGYDILDDGWLGVNLETFALFTLQEQFVQLAAAGQIEPIEEPADGPHIPAEWLLSVRTAGLLEGRFRASAGAGSMIPTGSDSAVTTPAFRAVVGLHYVWGDGVLGAGSADQDPEGESSALQPLRMGAAAR